MKSNTFIICLFALLFLLVVSPNVSSLTIEDDYFTGIQAHWKLENSTCTDETGFTGDCTVEGDTAFGDYGGLGNSAYFDGADSALLVNPDLQNTWSVSFWFNTTDTSVQWLFDDYDSSQRNLIGVIGSNTLRFSTGGSNIDITPTCTDGNWHHVVFTYSGTDAKVYFDGVSYSNSTVTSGYDIDGTTRIGSAYSSSTSTTFNGVIDEFTFWNTSLSFDSAVNLYNSGTPINYDGTGGDSDSNPVITLNSPVSAYSTNISTIDFNCSATDDINLDNVSLYLNGVLNETNTTGINADYIFTKTLALGDYNWTCEAFDNSSQSHKPSVRTLNVNNNTGVNTFMTNLAGYFRMDNSTMKEEISGATPTSDSSVNVSGKLLSGRDYETSSSLDTRYGDILDIDGGNYTWGAWVKPESFVNGFIIGKDQSGGRSWAFGISSAGRIMLQPAGTSGGSSNTTMSAGTWYLVVATFDEDTDEVKYYLNGEESGTGSSTGAITGSSTPVYLGDRSYGGDAEFDGIIDEVFVYDGRILTQDEIKELYNDGDGKSFDTFAESGSGGESTDNAPVGVAHFPLNNSLFTVGEIPINCTFYDDINLANVSFYLDSVLNATNSSGLNNSVYDFTQTLSAGTYKWYCSGVDNSSQITNTSERQFFVYSPTTWWESYYDDLIVYYDMENDSLVDRSGVSGDGATFNTTSIVSSGILGNALDVNYPSSSGFQQDNISTSDSTWTISVWVRSNNSATDGTHYTVFDSHNGTGLHRTIIHNGGGMYHADAYGPNWFFANDSMSINDNVWHHLAWVYNYTELKTYLYVDAVNVAIEPITSPSNVDGNVAIGVTWSGVSNTNYLGHIDELGVWDRALNSSEISNLYNNKYPPSFVAQESDSSDSCNVNFNSTSLSFPDTVLISSNCTTANTLYLNGTTISNNSVHQLGYGTYNITVVRTNQTGYSNVYDEQVLSVSKGNPSDYMMTSITSPITYGTSSDYSGYSWSYGSGGCGFALYLNGSLVDEGFSVTDNSQLSAGTYEYEYNTTGCANWTSASVTDNLVINKATPTISLNSDGLLSFTYDGTQRTINYSESNNGDSDVTYGFFKNELSAGTTDTEASAGFYVYHLNTTEGTNYTSISGKETVTLGESAIDRPSTVGGSYTQIIMGSRSNISGTIRNISVYTSDIAHNFYVGSFYNSSLTEWTPRDMEFLDDTDGAGLKEFTNLTINIEEGDFIGFYFDVGSGGVDRNDTGGDGVYYKDGNFTIGLEETYALSANRKLSFNAGVSQVKILEIEKNPSSCDVLFNESTPLELPKDFRAYTTCDTAFTFLRNDSLVTNNSVQDLSLGTYNFTVYRTDTHNYTNTQDTEIFALQDNTAPSFTSISNYTSLVNTDFSETITATDNQGIDTYFINDTSIFQINSTSGVLTNKTNLSTITVYTLNVSVNDTMGYTASQTISINITNSSIGNIILSLVTPSNNSVDTDGSIVFGYNVISDNNVTSCSLYYSGGLYTTDTSITNGTTNNFNIGDIYSDSVLFSENLRWWVGCTDGSISENSTSFYVRTSPQTGGSNSGSGGGSSYYEEDNDDTTNIESGDTTTFENSTVTEIINNYIKGDDLPDHIVFKVLVWFMAIVLIILLAFVLDILCKTKKIDSLSYIIIISMIILIVLGFSFYVTWYML